jgi:hypothetical protein
VLQPQLNPSNPEIDNRIIELENLLVDAGRQSDTESLRYLKDYIGFLKSYQKIKHSYKFINDLAAGDDEDGEVNAARFIKKHIASTEGKDMIWINSKIALTEEEFNAGVNKVTDVQLQKGIDKSNAEDEEEGEVKKAEQTSAPLVPLSDDINEMGVAQVDVPYTPNNPQKSFNNNIPTDKDNTTVPNRQNEIKASFEEQKGLENNDAISDENTPTEENPVVASTDKVSFIMRSGTANYNELKQIVNKIASGRKIDNVEFVDMNLNKTAAVVEFKIAEQNNTGEKKMGMWINSKLMLDDEGNIKQAEADKTAWNFDKKDDDKEDGKEEEKDEKKEETKDASIKLSAEEYAELETFISRIASEKGITDVSEISINLSKEAGSIEFKVTEFKKDDSGEEAVPAMEPALAPAMEELPLDGFEGEDDLEEEAVI